MLVSSYTGVLFKPMFLFVCPTHSPDLPVLPRPERGAAGGGLLPPPPATPASVSPLLQQNSSPAELQRAAGGGSGWKAGRGVGGLLPAARARHRLQIHRQFTFLFCTNFGPSVLLYFDHSVLVYYYVHIVIIYLMPTFLGFVLFVSSDKNVSARSSLVPSSV